MNITELLVTAFDGDKAVMAIDLTMETVATVLMAADGLGEVKAGQTRVVAVETQAARLLEAVRELLEELTLTPVVLK